MFASCWQILTAVFFISALTKLLYKLIKGDDHHHQERRPSRGPISLASSSRVVAGRSLNLQVVAGTEHEAAQVAAAGSISTQEEENLNDDDDEEFNTNSSQEEEVDGDDDDQLEDEEARRRIESRHLFRRQLHSSCPPEETNNEVGPVEENSASSLPQNGHNQNEHSMQCAHPQGASSIQEISHLQLIGEILLIEPGKLIYQVLSSSLSFICSILDSIEGIEATPASGLTGTRSQTATTGHHLQTKSSTRRYSEQQSLSSIKRSNYHHRRYLSRRSLSSALLDDDDDADADYADDDHQEGRIDSSNNDTFVPAIRVH